MNYQKLILVLVIILGRVLIYAQDEGNRLDIEFETVCLIDSISPTTQIEFKSIYHYNKDSYRYKTFDLSADYTPTGTILPCKEGLIEECWEVYSENALLNAYRVLTQASVNINQLSAIYDKYGALTPLNYPYNLHNIKDRYRFRSDLETYASCIGDCIHVHYEIVDAATAPGYNSKVVTLWIYSKKYVPNLLISSNIDDFNGYDNANYVTLENIFPFESFFGDQLHFGSIGYSLNNECYQQYKVKRSANNKIISIIDEYDRHRPALPDGAYLIDCFENPCSEANISNKECYKLQQRSEVCNYKTAQPPPYTRLGIEGISLNGTYYPVPDTVGYGNVTTAIIDVFRSNNYVYENVTLLGNLGYFIQGSNAVVDFIRIKHHVTGVDIDLPLFKSQCREDNVFEVVKNGYGGITSIQDQQGNRLLAMPVGATKVDCDDTWYYDIPEYSTVRISLSPNTVVTTQTFTLPNDCKEILLYNISECDVHMTEPLSNIDVWIPRNGTYKMANPTHQDINHKAFSSGATVTLDYDKCNVGPEVGGNPPAMIVNFKNY